mmetsp:Transcript_888/g.2415  ORF Transcript_888/g.2415 Transcript_888/m.2415 type:complete len:127 (-) Transcript_888:451-831(-)
MARMRLTLALGLAALAFLAFCGNRGVQARWGQGGKVGKMNEEAVKILAEAIEQETAETGVESWEDLDEDQLMKKVRKMKREAKKETVAARRAKAREREQSYVRSGRMVKHMAYAILIFMVGASPKT